MNTAKMRWFAGIVAAIALLGAGAAAAPAASASPTPPPTLAGETLSATNASGSNPLTVSGTATGPYPGTFTETISYQTFGPVSGTGGFLSGYTATFTIISGTTTVTGSEVETNSSQSNALLLPNGTFSFGGPTAYHATISTSGGNYLDVGTTQAGWSQSNGGITGSDVFTSTQAQTTPAAQLGLPSTLAGETLSLANETSNNPLTVSGTATGPYPGTFTETISYQTFGPVSGTGGSLSGYTATFTITSGTTTVTGTEHLANSSQSSALLLNGTLGVAAPTQYQATISPPGGGSYLDWGTTQANWSQSNGGITGSDVFDSTLVPVVVGVSPASGPLAGGTGVTITGSGFTGATAVSFGTAAATGVTVNNDGSITATAPSVTSAGPVDVTVTTPSGTSAASTADQYTYTAPVSTACALGTWSATGNAPCAPADPGNFVGTTGATSQTPCQLGSFQPSAGQASCVAAPIGSYVDTTGATAATACPAGMTTLATGSTSSADCQLPAGTACAAGTWSATGNAPCAPADPGNFVGTTGATSQTPCGLGTFQPLAGQASCSNAPAGSFVGTTGATSATQCQPGTFQPLAGQASCSNAPAGSFVGTTGATSATPCAAGTYQPSAGQAGCVAAPIGSYVDTTGATAATACPAGMTTLATGSTSSADCQLPAGTTTASLTDSGGHPIAGAAVTFRPASGPAANATTGPDGTASVTLTPGTYSVTMYYAGGYQTKTLSVTATGPNQVSFATIAVTAQINDPNSADLAAASVAHAGNTGTFGPKTPVDPGSGQVTFQVLPGTNTFTAYDAGGYQTKTVSVTGPVTVTFTTVPVIVQINDTNADLTAASVAHAGNTGTYGPKTPVDPTTGQVTFQVLPGTNTFTAYDAAG